MSFNLGPWQWEIQQTLILLGLVVAGTTVLLFSLITTLWAITRRLFTRSPARFFTVLILNLLAYGSLALLLAPPFTLSTVEQQLVLLTAGAQIDEAESHSDLFVAPGIDIEPASNASWLLDIGQLRLQRPAISSLKVLGHGLSAEQWAEIPDHAEVNFEASPLSGLVGIRWPGQLNLGEQLVVVGRYQNAESQAARLELIDPAGEAVDEILLRPGQEFSLSSTPRVAGRHEYLLRLWHDDQANTEETVATSVTSGRGARLLVIQSAPSFETRQLKNWAVEYGTPLLMLTRISRDRHISQAVNLPDNADTKLSPALLARQDLVILDGRSWVDFSAVQRAWLSAAVHDGLGLLVMADHTLAEALPKAGDALLGDFSMRPVEQENELTVPSWPGAKPQTPLPFLPFSLEARQGRTVVTGEQGEALNLVVAVGRGQVALSILREQYRWPGAGERAVYTAYWAMLMRETGRRRSTPYLLPGPADSLNSVAHKMNICARGNGQAMNASIQGPAIAGEGPMPQKDSQLISVDFAEDLLGSARQCATFWPTEPGWHQLSLQDTVSGEVLDQASFYVFKSSEWLTYRQQLKQQASLQRVARNPLQQDQVKSRATATPLSSFWPWLVLMVAASLLWLERKLDFGK